MGPEEFRAAGHELIDWIADYRARIPQLPVQAQVGRVRWRGSCPSRAPEEAEPFGRVLADLERIVVPGVTQVQHPRYFGWFPSNASLSSVLGDLAASGLGALGITWQSAPALTEVEEVVVEWLRELTGLPAVVEGRHPGHRVQRVPGRPAGRARARDGLLRGPRRAAGRERAADRLHHRARALLDPEGRGPGRLRAGQPAGWSTSTRSATPCAPKRWPRRWKRTWRPAGARPPSWPASAPPAPRPWTRSRRSSRWPGSTGCGCTSTRRWRARRCCCRRCAGSSTGSKARTRWPGTRTSGWAPCWTARCCTSPTRTT